MANEPDPIDAPRLIDTYPPFWRLILGDFDRLLTQSFLIGLCLTLLGLVAMAQQWLRTSVSHLSDGYLIVVTLPPNASAEEVQRLSAQLQGQSQITRLEEFGPGQARALLQASGLDAPPDELLAEQPRGFSFAWRNLIDDPDAFAQFRQTLLNRAGLQIHYDQERVRRLQVTHDSMIHLFRRFLLWGSGIVIVCVALISLANGRVRSTQRLPWGEAAQAHFVRGGLAGLVGWVAAGAVLKALSQQVLSLDIDSSWWPLLWVVPVAAVAGLLALLPSRGEPVRP